MTEERRREMIKVARHKGEEAKVAIRNVRRKAKEELDRIVKDGEVGEDDGRRAEKELDDLTHRYVGHRRRAGQAQGSRAARGLSRTPALHRRPTASWHRRSAVRTGRRRPVPPSSAGCHGGTPRNRAGAGDEPWPRRPGRSDVRDPAGVQ